MFPHQPNGLTQLQLASPWRPDVTVASRSVGHVEEVVDAAELRDVVFYKILAERVEDTDPPQPADNESASPAIHVLERHDVTHIEVRCALSFVGEGGRYEVDAAARYELTEPLEIPPAIMREFVTRVGLMAVYPYLRESLHLSASKLRLKAPVMGLLKAGSIELTVEPKPIGE
jgi:hypothetical protein